MRGKRGGRWRPLCSVFCPVTSRGAPWEPWEHRAASWPLLWFHALMLFTLSSANCFSVAQNTRPVLFIMMMLSYNGGLSAHWLCCGNAHCLNFFYFHLFSQYLHCYFDLILSCFLFPQLSFPFALCLTPLPLLPVFSSIAFQFLGFLLICFLHFYSFLHLFLSFLSHLFPLVSSLLVLSSAPLHWVACNHVCTTSCQFERIHAPVFCHLRKKRDWSFLSYLSHISGGRISMKSI